MTDQGTYTDITNPEGNVIFFQFKGVVYRRSDSDVVPCVELKDCKVMSLDISASKIAAGYRGIPWVVSNDGKVYQAFCNKPNDYFDQKTYDCVKICPIDTTMDIATKTCILLDKFKFTLKGTNAVEIASQGDYTYIVKNDNSLNRYDKETSTFIKVDTSATLSTIKKLAVDENGVLYTCTYTREFWKIKWNYLDSM